MADSLLPNRTSSYLQYLPAILQADASGVFLGRFLLAFEQVLSHRLLDDNQIQNLPATAPVQGQPQAVRALFSPLGLENILDQLYIYFLPQQSAQLGDAGQAPADFLPWLASWVALTLRNDWDETTQRQFISQMVTLYQQRGTLPGLRQLLVLYTGNDSVAIYDQFDGLPYYFEVTMTMATSDPVARARQFQIAQSLIDQEKPAHTYYTLKIYAPTMRIVNTAPESGQPDNRLYIYPATGVASDPQNLTIFGTTEA